MVVLASASAHSGSVQDLLVASLFRNFLLADRIMRAASCTPASYPRLPSTHQHPMWQVHQNVCSAHWLELLGSLQQLK